MQNSYSTGQNLWIWNHLADLIDKKSPHDSPNFARLIRFGFFSAVVRCIVDRSIEEAIAFERQFLNNYELLNTHEERIQHLPKTNKETPIQANLLRLGVEILDFCIFSFVDHSYVVYDPLEYGSLLGQIAEFAQDNLPPNYSNECHLICQKQWPCQ